MTVVTVVVVVVVVERTRLGSRRLRPAPRDAKTLSSSSLSNRVLVLECVAAVSTISRRRRRRRCTPPDAVLSDFVRRFCVYIRDASVVYTVPDTN